MSVIIIFIGLAVIVAAIVTLIVVTGGDSGDAVPSPLGTYESEYLGAVKVPVNGEGRLETVVDGVTIKVVNGTEHGLSWELNYDLASLASQEAAVAQNGDGGVDLMLHLVYFTALAKSVTGDDRLIPGDTLLAVYDFPDGPPNAGAYSDKLYIGTTAAGKSFATADIVGHELGHMLVRTYAGVDNGGHSAGDGLVYQAESGALNEAYADIFGAAYEFYIYELFNEDVDPLNDLQGVSDWVIGEDLDPNRKSYIRNMANPALAGDPMVYQGANWVNTGDTSQGNDYGGVHTNSSVIDHLFYLVSVQLGSWRTALGHFYTVLRTLEPNTTMPQFATKLRAVGDFNAPLTAVGL